MLSDKQIRQTVAHYYKPHKILTFEDFVNEAYLRCLKDQHKYDPEKGAETTFYAKRIRGAVKEVYRTYGYQKRTSMRDDFVLMSTADMFYENSDVLHAGCADKFSYTQNPEITRILKDILAMDTINGRMLRMSVVGYSNREIADHFNVSESRVSQRLIEIRNKLKEWY